VERESEQTPVNERSSRVFILKRKHEHTQDCQDMPIINMIHKRAHTLQLWPTLLIVTDPGRVTPWLGRLSPIEQINWVLHANVQNCQPLTGPTRPDPWRPRDGKLQCWRVRPARHPTPFGVLEEGLSLLIQLSYTLVVVASAVVSPSTKVTPHGRFCSPCPPYHQPTAPSGSTLSKHLSSHADFICICVCVCVVVNWNEWILMCVCLYGPRCSVSN